MIILNYKRIFGLLKREFLNASKHVFAPTQIQSSSFWLWGMSNAQERRWEIILILLFNIILFFYIVIIFTFSLASLVVIQKNTIKLSYMGMSNFLLFSGWKILLTFFPDNFSISLSVFDVYKTLKMALTIISHGFFFWYLHISSLKIVFRLFFSS